MEKVTKEILRRIILAQIGSDSAKNHHPRTNVSGWQNAMGRKYAAKNAHMAKVIRLIDANPNCGIQYALTRDDKKQYVVYFIIDKRIFCKSHQKILISFHAPHFHRGSFWDTLFHTKEIRNAHRLDPAYQRYGIHSKRACHDIAKRIGFMYSADPKSYK